MGWRSRRCGGVRRDAGRKRLADGVPNDVGPMMVRETLLATSLRMDFPRFLNFPCTFGLVPLRGEFLDTFRAPSETQITASLLLL